MIRRQRFGIGDVETRAGDTTVVERSNKIAGYDTCAARNVDERPA